MTHKNRIPLPMDEIVKLATVDKMKLEDIADKYYVCSATIASRLHELGIKLERGKGPKPVLDSINREHLVKLLHDPNLTLKRICLILNISQSALRRYIVKHNLKEIKRYKNARTN